MAIILIAKVLLEVFSFVGVARQYGEEDIFVSLALPSKEQGRTYWDSIAAFRSVSDWAAWTGDPSDMYPFRIAALYPNMLFVKVFGASESSLILWSAITGISAVLLVALIGRSLAGAATGLFSGAVLALIPAHTIYSARIATDMPQLFYMSLSVLFLVLSLKAATKRRQLVFGAMSGLSIGFLYLSKLLPALLSLPWALFVPLLLVAWGDHETLLAPGGKLRQAITISAAVLGGFALVFAAENCAYHRLAGQWFLHWRIMKGNAVNMESWRSAEFYILGPVKLWLPNGGMRDLFGHAQMFYDSLFPVGRFYSVYSAPIHGWSAVAFLPAFLVLPFLRISHRKLSIILILGFVFYYLYQEFFWLYPTIEAGKLNLTFVNKVHRFLFPCYIGISLCVGLALGQLTHFGGQHSQRWPRRIFQLAPVLLVLAFGAANYPSLQYFHSLLRGSLMDLRRVCSDLKTIAPDGARIFVAAGSEPYFRVFQYPRHYEWKYFVDGGQEAICNGWGVIGGSSGIGVSPATFAEGYPSWLRPYYLGLAGPASGWQLVSAKASAADPAAPTVRIFKLPECSSPTVP
jgi:4-amino-4-deoxy-L-arabinose transferase-like glycosyltransferase